MNNESRGVAATIEADYRRRVANVQAAGGGGSRSAREGRRRR